jgi:hypothetical protein
METFANLYRAFVRTGAASGNDIDSDNQENTNDAVSEEPQLPQTEETPVAASPQKALVWVQVGTTQHPAFLLEEDESDSTARVQWTANNVVQWVEASSIAREIASKRTRQIPDRYNNPLSSAETKAQRPRAAKKRRANNTPGPPDGDDDTKKSYFSRAKEDESSNNDEDEGCSAETSKKSPRSRTTSVSTQISLKRARATPGTNSSNSDDDEGHDDE